MRRSLHVWQLGGVLAFLLFAPTIRAVAAEIVLEHTAVDKLIVQTLFKEEGRHYLVRGGCHAYLETPTSSLKEGRIWIRSHLTSKVGVPALNSCVGVTLSSWTVVSGQPVVKGGAVRLDDIRVEEVEDSKIRFLLNSGLVPALPRAVELDVLKAVGSMLKTYSPQMQTNVEVFQIDSVSAADDKLAVKFDFKLVAK